MHGSRNFNHISELAQLAEFQFQCRCDIDIDEVQQGQIKWRVHMWVHPLCMCKTIAHICRNRGNIR